MNVWKYCTEVFDFLSLSAIIDDRVFCVRSTRVGFSGESGDDARML